MRARICISGGQIDCSTLFMDSCVFDYLDIECFELDNNEYYLWYSEYPLSSYQYGYDEEIF